MKRFIDIGKQVGEENQFAFYCTVKDEFEYINDTSLWESAAEFEADFKASGRKNIERYLNLIPDRFTEKGMFACIGRMADAFNDKIKTPATFDNSTTWGDVAKQYENNPNYEVEISEELKNKKI